MGAVCQDSTSGNNDRAVSAPGKEIFYFLFIYNKVRGCRLRTWKIASARRRHCEHAPEIVLHCLQAPRTHMPPLPHLYFFILYFITTTGHTVTVPHHQRPTFYREDILLLLLTHRHCPAPPTPHPDNTTSLLHSAPCTYMYLYVSMYIYIYMYIYVCVCIYKSSVSSVR